MSTRGIDASPDSSESPAQMRARAERVRTMARSLANDEAGERLRNYADELDARAAVLEKNKQLS
jgi:hypothetical protein